MNGKVHIMDHPLVAHKMTILRDKNTSVKDFRELVSEIGMLITYEATRDLPLTTKEVETPICKTVAPTLKGKKFAVVPILRAGLGLVDGVLRMVPGARVGHIGMYRDEETLEPHVYFCKLPKDIAEREVMIVDPMLATGGSAVRYQVWSGDGCRSVGLTETPTAFFVSWREPGRGSGGASYDLADWDGLETAVTGLSWQADGTLLLTCETSMGGISRLCFDPETEELSALELPSLPEGGSSAEKDSI